MIFDEIQKYENKTALVGADGQRLSYGRLVEEADWLAGRMEPRAVVFLMSHNCMEAIIGYVAMLRGRQVPVLLGRDLDTTLFQELYNSYQPAYIWTPESNLQDIPGMTWERIASYGSYTLYRTGVKINYQVYSELALLLTTSGSTGSPKLVRQSYKNIVSNTRSIIEYLEISSLDRAITTMPMNYTYGLSILNTHLFSGAVVILTDATFMDKSFWELLRAEKATTFGGVPYIYEILKKLRFRDMDLPAIRYLTQAGGKLPEELAEEFYRICEKKGIKFIVMYGQTEATARMSYLPYKYVNSKAGSIGIAIPGGRFELFDGEGRKVISPGVTGELIYYGDNVTLGYAKDCHDLEKGDENQGVLYTGDMAKRDNDGFYYIVGRRKRFLKLFGNRVNLDEVEGLLKKQGIENACTGIDDSLHVYITDASLEEAVKEFLTHHTGVNKNGFKVFWVQEIPRNSSGKVLYSALE